MQEEKGRVEPGSTEEPDMQIVVLAASHNCVRLPPAGTLPRLVQLSCRKVFFSRGARHLAD